MKKIYTVLFASFLMATAFGQRGQNNQSDWRSGGNDYAVNTNDRFYNSGNAAYGLYVFTPAERDRQIDQINREYDRKIRYVKNQFYTSNFRIDRQIRVLETQRVNEIQTVLLRFSDRRNQFGDFNKNKHFKKNKHNRW